MGDWALALLIGFALDALIGDPEWFPHPVRLTGSSSPSWRSGLRIRGGNLRASAVVLTASTVLRAMAVTAAFLGLLSPLGRLLLLIGMTLVD